MDQPIDDVEWWRRRYSDTQPIGWALRHSFPNRWFRIHSLPEAQRYPADDADWDTLLHRHRAVSNELIQPKSPCYLITPWSCAKDDCFADYSLRLITSLPEFRPELDEPPTGGYFGARIEWDFDRFEPVLRAAAQWESLSCVVSEDRLCAYAPYDGGADLFLPDASTRDTLKGRFTEYLSDGEDGL